MMGFPSHAMRFHALSTITQKVPRHPLSIRYPLNNIAASRGILVCERYQVVVEL